MRSLRMPFGSVLVGKAEDELAERLELGILSGDFAVLSLHLSLVRCLLMGKSLYLFKEAVYGLRDAAQGRLRQPEMGTHERNALPCLLSGHHLRHDRTCEAHPVSASPATTLPSLLCACPVQDAMRRSGQPGVHADVQAHRHLQKGDRLTGLRLLH